MTPFWFTLFFFLPSRRHSGGAVDHWKWCRFLYEVTNCNLFESTKAVQGLEMKSSVAFYSVLCPPSLKKFQFYYAVFTMGVFNIGNDSEFRAPSSPAFIHPLILRILTPGSRRSIHDSVEIAVGIAFIGINKLYLLCWVFFFTTFHYWISCFGSCLSLLMSLSMWTDIVMEPGCWVSPILSQPWGKEIAM